MPRDWSVGRLLTRAFGALVVLIVCSGLAETAAMLVQHRVGRQLTTHVQPLELANAHLQAVLADAQRGLRGYLLTGDQQLLNGYLIAHSDYPLAVDDVRALATAGERPAVDTQAVRADTWWSLAERQRRAEPRTDVAARFVAEGKPLFDQFEDANQAFDLALAARTAGLQRESAQLNALSVSTVLAFTVAAAAFAALTARRMTRLITRPLGGLVDMLARRRAGDRAVRADPFTGPAEIRAVAAEVNASADENARADAAEQEVSRLRGAVRGLGYRIRAHLVVEDAVREAVSGLHAILGADHVLIRMAADQMGVPPLTSLHDEHRDGPLTALAACDVTWLNGGDVWATDDPAPAGDVSPPEAEQAAWAQVGDGPVLIVAVSGGEERIGALTLIRDSGPAWTPVEVRLAEVVANDLGRGVHLARQYEREHALVNRLRELDTAKTDFMSTVSHELRTPLTSIAGYVELLRDAEAGEISPGQDRMLEVIGRNTRRLRELIEDMLVLSKIEAGGFRTSKEAVDLADLIDGAVQAITPAAAKASVGLHLEVAGPLPWTPTPGRSTGSWRTCSATRSSSPRPRGRSRSPPGATGPTWWSRWPTPAWASPSPSRRPCSPASSAPATPSIRPSPAPGWAWPSSGPSSTTTAAGSSWRPPNASAPPSPSGYPSESRRGIFDAMGSDFSEQTATDAVVASFAGTSDPRLREILDAFTRHLHDFVSEVEPTQLEWEQAVGFLTRTGQKCDDTRQEYILFSDVMGVSMLVDAINNRKPAGATESTVLGPFHVVASPVLELGADIAAHSDSPRCLVRGRVLDLSGRPVPGARVDVWQADDEGFYDVQKSSGRDLRGLFTTDAGGHYRFTTIVPRHYPSRTTGRSASCCAPPAGTRTGRRTSTSSPARPATPR